MKRILKMAAATVFLALALIFLKNEYARLLPVSTYGMQAALRKESIDNLFIGSSMFRQGLDIDTLDEELPGNSYILSYNGNQPALMAMELSYLLEEGLEIKNLYIDLYPYTAAATPWISDTKILLDTDLSFKAAAWKLMKSGGDADFGDFYEFFVTANNEQLLTYPLNNRIVSAQFRDGGSLLEAQGKTKEELAKLDLLGSRDGVNPLQAEGYEKIAKLAKQYQLNLYFLETPKYERMNQDGDYQELYAECLSIIEALQKSRTDEDGIKIVSAKDLDFDSSKAEYYQDLIHLSAEGRKEYTRLLCEKIKSK